MIRLPFFPAPAARTRPVSVLVVDDSGFMRLALRKMLARDPTLRVIGEASTGEEALRLARVHRPDVVTMDVEMPGGGGLLATREIMAQCPTSIIMVSSLTRAAADTTLKALAAGAVDYIPKASSFVDLDIVAIEKELCRKIHYWADRRPAAKAALGATTARAPALSGLRPTGKPDLLIIGASTGGPKILPQLFSELPKLDCPVVIALHMPPVYTQSFAEHLAADSGHDVVEGHDGMTLTAGQVVVAPGGTDSHILTGARSPVLRVRREEQYGIHPSVDALFLSAAVHARNPLAVVLTGMGDDGLRGSRELHRRGLPVLAQNESSCLVYGMPRAVAEAGLASELLDVAGLAQRLRHWCSS
ncbi:MAG: chemotaxis-specific protein-glutamate methyltransferase CheB [Moraxellaceae bacterium]|nr:chemotaxis-specific protein-glutamate methyltransferase CheB [Moraxellaceae bacterium]